MPTPRKRQADEGASAASTPRSSKRIRGSHTGVTQETLEEPVHAPATTPSRSVKRTKATATVPVPNGGAVVATVVKAEPQTPSPSKKAKKAKDSRSPAVKAEVTLVNSNGASGQKAVAKQAKGHRTSKIVKPDPDTDEEDSDKEAAKEKSKQKRQKAQRTAKGQPKSGDMSHPLASRTAGHVLRLGAHVSAAGGVQNSVGNAVHIGANAFALFLKSQRKWANPPLQEEQATAFVDGCKAQDYNAGKYVVPHGSYLVNLAQSEKERATQALDNFIDDLQRCDRLGIKLYNFHPGSTLGAPRAEALSRIAEALNKAHAASSSVVTLLENMAGKGNIIGGPFSDLGAIIKEVKDKSRVGVCLDTCHAFAYGHDLRTASALSATLDDLEKECGKGMLRALHVNDSKAPLASHRDLHANIGTGYLGLRAFHALVNEPRLHGLPMVLETPIDRKTEDGKTTEDRAVWAREIKLLESLVGMDVDSDIFRKLEKELEDQGKAERERIGGQVSRKKDKDDKKAKGTKGTKAKGKGGKRKQETASEESEESE